jgi:hypothetical protein
MRYFQFSMGTMLMATSIAAIGAGVLGWHVRRLNQIATDVSFLRSTRANVDLAIPDSTLVLKLAPTFSGYPTSVRKYFDTPAIADVDKFVAAIERNPSITELVVDGSHLDDAHVQRLLSLPLKSLSISQCSTGHNLPAHASNSITWLGLQRTRVDDRSLQAMGGLQNVEHLDLTRTRVSDDSINFISQLPSLKKLIVRRCKITDAGRARLKSMRPNLAIEWEPIHN